MSQEYSSKNFDHLGIVSQICDEIGIVEKIDSLIPPDPQQKITLGECVKLMVINGLGFTSRPLYLEAQFFGSRPVNRFLKKECSESVNDDRLGRALDQMFAFGCDRLFSSLATQAVYRFGVSTKFRHLDSTSMEVHGEYANDDEEPLITFGYSKGHRPDLKQFMIYLMCSQDGDVPLLAQTVAGNASDKKLFRERLESLKGQIKEGEDSYFVADSALYVEKTLETISSIIKWITRVPEKLTLAKELIRESKDLTILEAGYKGKEVIRYYAGVEQRWLLVHSEQAYQREVKTLKRRINKELEERSKDLRKFCSEEFDCPNDAEAALKRWSKGIKYHKIEEMHISERRVKQGKGRPRSEDLLEKKYRIQASLVEDKELIDASLARKGFFIIATNELDQSRLSSIELLQNYKGQQSVERGFRFLKEPAFMTSSVFLKKQERVVALAMVMCICLLVYTIAQRYLRAKLLKSRETIPNQLGKPTTRPTMKWIFQLFEGVHILIHKTGGESRELILNMTQIRYHVLSILGPPFEKMYSAA